MTFRELSIQPEVTVAELKTLLTEHADGEIGIDGETITSILRRKVLSNEEKEDLRQVAERGVDSQTRKYLPGEAFQYEMVRRCLK